MSASCPLLPCPVEAGLAPLLRRLRRERSRPRERLLPRPKTSPRTASYLKSAIRPSPSLFSICTTRPITALDISIEVGVDQVRQSSASSFEAMPAEPTRSQNMTVIGGVHERWLRGAQSPRVNSELPNLTRQSTQRRAGVDLEARIPRSIPVRKECATSRPFSLQKMDRSGRAFASTVQWRGGTLPPHFVGFVKAIAYRRAACRLTAIADDVSLPQTPHRV